MNTRLSQIAALQATPSAIRNICILAHVDHGKTTFSDCLLSSNGIISSKLAGTVRYLDSRPDEQERGITMKSSAITLFFQLLTSEGERKDFLVNLIDSPGHVDFSSEVSTASRLCDGGLVLVDAVEGVCTQTHTVLRQARMEKVKPILVINKIDRLITELKLSPLEAYQHLKKIIEQVNAILGVFEVEDLLGEATKRYEANKIQQDQSNYEDCDEIIESEHVYFSPAKGNVIFSSAIDGWAFRINQFARLYSKKLGMKESLLNKVLWGDYYLDKKAKRVVNQLGLKGRLLKPLFVQFVLENVWAVYESVLNQPDRTKLESIISKLSVKVEQRELSSKDSRSLLKTVMSQWLPLSSAVLLAVIQQIPSPCEAQANRMKILTNEATLNHSNEKQIGILKSMTNCDISSSSEVVIYVSKMFSINRNELPTVHKPHMTPEELKELRENIKAKSRNLEADRRYLLILILQSCR